jgi:GTP cyclohydrolase I
MVRFFAQRPQVQERLNEQVLVPLQTLLETDDVAVSITATHFCLKARGVMDANSDTRKKFFARLTGIMGAEVLERVEPI